MVLDLAPEVCAAQAMGRKDHEGGLEGPEAKSVVLAMTSKLRKEGTPSKSEGLASIIVSLAQTPHGWKIRSTSHFHHFCAMGSSLIVEAWKAERKMHTIYGKLHNEGGP